MKREPVDDEREQNGWLANTLRQSPGDGEGCLDAETLAAWADGGLGAQAAAAVELHASNCAGCTAVLAALARTAPDAAVRPEWTTARLFRWLAPLAGAATAVAIWVVVPDRPIVPEQSKAVQDLRATSERADAAAESDRKSAEGVPVPVPPVPELDARKQNTARNNQDLEQQSAAKPVPEQKLQGRDELRRERSAAESPAASLGGAAPEAPAAPPPAAAAPSAARSAPPADTLAETVTTTTAQRSAFSAAAPPAESAAPSNLLIRWRAIAPASIERSTDGGKTWTRATPLPGVAANATPAFVVVAVRSVDADRAVVGTSDGREHYTTNGGLSWTRVQENSKAPF
jgi:hypothetical protein